MNHSSEIPNIPDYLESLRRRLHPVESVRQPPPGDRKVAAVLLPLIRRNGGLELVYTRRSERLLSHPGQVSFPGGRFDHRDKNLLAAALRETHEEIGIAPHQVSVLGTFPGQRTRATNISVTPFVGAVADEYSFEPDPKEVAEIFSVPISALSDRRYRGPHRFQREGVAMSSPAIHYAGQVIWGLTFTLTIAFLQLAAREARAAHRRVISSK